MTLVATEDKIDIILAQTSYVKTEVSQQDKINKFLDLVSEIRDDLNLINEGFIQLIGDLKNQYVLAQKQDFGNTLFKLNDLNKNVKSFIKTVYGSQKFKLALATVLRKFEDLADDLEEVIADLELIQKRRIHPASKKINASLGLS
jgi:hypothetical protein